MNNPHWEALREYATSDSDVVDEAGGLSIDWLRPPPTQRTLHRTYFTRTYSWAIPDPETLTFVAKHLGRKAIEIGAGTGYWAMLLAQCGMDILAFDRDPVERMENPFHSPHAEALGGVTTSYYPVRMGGPTVLTRFPKRSLFLCWPPYNTPMALKCLRAYRGDRLVYIGEWGGCNAEERFFETLESEWDEVATHRIVQWDCIHDRVYAYHRKRG